MQYWTMDSDNSDFRTCTPADDFMSKDELCTLQTRLFRKHLAYSKANSPHYRKLLDGLDIESFTLDRIGELPLTSKSVLASDTDSFQAVPWSKVRDISFTSGTVGEPCRLVYTQSDLDRNAYNEFRSFTSMGVGPCDRVLLTCTLDRCFIAGAAYWMGGVRAGAAMIRNGLTTLESHLDLIRRIRPTVIIGIASFLDKLGRAAVSSGTDLGSVRILLCVGEPIRTEQLELNSIGLRLRKSWKNARFHGTYASSETCTAFTECSFGKGGHLIPELAYVEVVDDSGRTLPPGETGEIVVTPFGIQGFPLIRYRTGDISFMVRELCPCGRHTPRLGPVLGRKAHMMKVRGTTLYPQAVYNILSACPEVLDYYLVATGKDLSDQVEVHVSLRSGTITPEQLTEKIRSGCRVGLPVIAEDPDEVHRKVYSARKPVHLFDLRENRLK